MSPPGPADWLELSDDSGQPVPFLAEGVSRRPDGSLAGVTITFRAADVPAYRVPHLPGPAHRPGGRRRERHRPGRRAPGSGWQPAAGHAIENDRFAVTADPARGGTLTSVRDKRTGTELLSGPGNELILQPEHARHPRWGEGPWLLCPAGPGPRLVGAAGRGDRRAVPGRPAAGHPADAGRPADHPGDAAVGRRGPGGVPDPRRWLDRLRQAAAGGLPGAGTGRAAGLPHGGVGHRPATGSRGHRRGGEPVHPRQPGP